MSLRSLNIDAAVDFVIENQKRFGDGEELVSAVTSLGLTAEEAERLIRTVRDAYGRFMLMSAGMNARQFHGDYESDPIFQAALNRFLAASPIKTDQGGLSRLAWFGMVLGGLVAICGAVMMVVRVIQFFRAL